MIPVVSETLAVVLNVVTTVGTAAAALAAAFAVRQASKVASRQHALMVQRDQFLDAVALLEAYERLQVLRYDADSDEPDHAGSERMVQALAAEGEFKARVRASEERLELTRAVLFDHIPPPEDQLAKAALEFGWPGSPERETTNAIVVRGEILAIVNRRRAQLSAASKR
ncbi:hypothetical protein HPO96_35155 [Kribbella sandramycini]|uniref:Uncharacterized protein n=1 Tax=Kribbella sandramycini TaxID=60450 RepID=A0A7Y4P4R5_9ACTN|nr:hypothetical protein [Kribbella sandramycini]MBB6566713.1 hypothetical protein [Kribbella sandramycini]NOL45499.1 hypothetical protein [Kribbella sandramycini]